MPGTEVCRRMRAIAPVPGDHGDRPQRRDRHRPRASSWVRPTTSPSPTACASWWPASRPCCAACRHRRSPGRLMAHAEASSRSDVVSAGPVRVDFARRGRHRRRPGRAPVAPRVRPARPAAVPPGSGAHPRRAHRPPVVGAGSGRHPHPRHPHPPTARQARARSGPARSTSSPCAAWVSDSTPKGVASPTLDRAY